MNAHLAAEHAVRVPSLYLNSRLVKADALTRDEVEDGHLPLLALGITGKHAIEHLGPVLRLQASLSGVYAQNRVSPIEPAREPGVDFKLVEKLCQLREALFRLLRESLVLLRQLHRRAHVFEHPYCLLVLADHIA